MRTTTTALAVIGIAATAALALPAAGSAAAPALESAPAPASAAGTVRAADQYGHQTVETERGVVLECTGSARGTSAYVNVYENDRYANYLQVIINDDPATAGSREPADLWKRGRVHGAVRVGGERAVVHGTAVRVGKPKRIHEEINDNNQHIVSDGVHRRLRTHLVVDHAGVRIPLTCDPAFSYRLRVTKTDIIGD